MDLMGAAECKAVRSGSPRSGPWAGPPGPRREWVEVPVACVQYSSTLQSLRLLHPFWDSAFAMEHAPYVDVLFTLDVEDEVGVAGFSPMCV